VVNQGEDRLRNGLVAPLLTILSVGTANAGDNTVHRQDPATGIETWELATQGVSLRLTQILPDQVRAFYLGRGFDVPSVELLATQACVFQTVFRNESSGGPIRFHLGEWRALTARGETPLRLDADWQHEWERRGVPVPARTAFRFALYPTEHAYAVGDWNMGMTFFPLALGSRFDLRFAWRAGETRLAAILRAVRCATDTVPREK
jgi:hypothetical protein